VAARTGARDRRRDHRLSFGDGAGGDLDGALRMEARGGSVAGRGAPRDGAARAPNLNPRMSPCAGGSHLNPRMLPCAGGSHLNPRMLPCGAAAT
jgi:hypothetical protein